MSGCLIKKLSASIGIIGAGAYGTALAMALARNDHLVLLWDYNKHISELKDSKATFVPNISFSERIVPETDLAKVVNASRDLIVVVPSHAFRNVLTKLKPYLRIDSRIIWGTKGLEQGTGRLLQDVAREILGNKIPLAIISGPTFAKELAAGFPIDIILASTDKQFAEDLQHKLHCDKSFRVYISSDCIGVQLGGVIKNVIAISVGISDGIGFGSNFRMALITRGLAEMTQLGIVLGADPITFMGMAGLGDLILTCTDNQSRNRRFGIMLGQGKSIEEAQRIIGQVVEGYVNNKEINLLADSVNVDMPISKQIYQVLYCQKSVIDAATSLLNS